MKSQILINTVTTNQQSYSNCIQSIPTEFICFWQSNGQTTNLDIYGQRFDLNGNKILTETLINTKYSILDQIIVKSTVLGNGKIVVIWNSNHSGPKNYYGNIFHFDLTKFFPDEFLIKNNVVEDQYYNQYSLCVCSLNLNSFVIAFKNVNFYKSDVLKNKELDYHPGDNIY